MVRSSIAFRRGTGKIFYFARPDTKPSRFKTTLNILRVIGDADCRWETGTILPPQVRPQPEPPERVATENPLKNLDQKNCTTENRGDERHG
ncbi:MAG: hypothetical protein V8T86_08435 [Victivallis sp.]